MSKHRSIVEAIKAAENLGDGHGLHWKNWLVDNLGGAHRDNECFYGSFSADSHVMYDCERQRKYLGPSQRVVWNDRLGESSETNDAGPQSLSTPERSGDD